jgi:23S rRNA (cytosine1962-C5)-methyltransferase
MSDEWVDDDDLFSGLGGLEGGGWAGGEERNSARHGDADAERAERHDARATSRRTRAHGGPIDTHTRIHAHTRDSSTGRASLLHSSLIPFGRVRDAVQKKARVVADTTATMHLTRPPQSFRPRGSRPAVLAGATQRKRTAAPFSPASPKPEPERRGGGGSSDGGGRGGRGGAGRRTSSPPPIPTTTQRPPPSTRPVHLELAKDLGRSLLAGAPWVYRDALSPSSAALLRSLPAGALALVKHRDGTILAKGFVDPSSPIAFRALATRERLDPQLVRDRLERCAALRRAALPADDVSPTTGYRLVNGEGDGLPGLHADVYGDVAVLKLDGAGAEAFYLEPVVAWLSGQGKGNEGGRWAGAGSVDKEGGKGGGGGACRGPVRTVWLKYRRQRRGGGGRGGGNGGAAAHQDEEEDEEEEEEEQQAGNDNDDSARGRTLFGPPPSSSSPVPFFEHGIRFTADVVRGQKTGFFLDQRDNRARMRLLAGGGMGGMGGSGGSNGSKNNTPNSSKRALNLFAYSGGFSLHMGKGGAAHVTSVDASPGACAAAEAHWRDPANGLDPSRHESVCGDVFAFLEQARARGQGWDLVVCDPPSFAPSAAAARGAAGGAYRRVFAAAAGAVNPGGVLALASCSSHVPRAEFELMASDALSRARRKGLCLGGTFGAGMDHPFPLAAPELSYLKFAAYQLD